ncbi:MAG TPA: ATPase domain-containing protein [Gaiellaceae bacterium]|nr:ATPase domain-containing protein [Gaiellaceae bacterium]
MTERLLSGDPKLDRVLGGGLPANSITVVAGAPGSGKTILAHQYVFANASRERPALYLTTVSEPFDKVLRYGQTLTFFEAGLVGNTIVYEDLGLILASRGLTAALDRIDTLIKERRPGFIVIDSFTVFRDFAADDSEFRRFLHTLAGRLSAFPATSFWLGEYDGAELFGRPEFTVADAILHLSTKRISERELREFEVRKLRGSDFLMGRHAYRLSSDGVDVFPRLADPAQEGPYELNGDKRITSGIEALDGMLAEGYWPGASTLVAGPSGCGKTLFGLHFVFAGSRQGEPGLIATLQENPVQLERVVRGFGWSLEEDEVEVMYRSPVDIYIDQWFHELLERVERGSVRRVLIDSLDDLGFTTQDDVRFREYMYSLVQRCAQNGVSLMMTLEVPHISRITHLSDFNISHLADNVVLLQYVWAGSHVKRALTVLKARASALEPTVREFKILPDGIVLGDELAYGRDIG